MPLLWLLISIIYVIVHAALINNCGSLSMSSQIFPTPYFSTSSMYYTLYTAVSCLHLNCTIYIHTLAITEDYKFSFFPENGRLWIICTKMEQQFLVANTPNWLKLITIFTNSGRFECTSYKNTNTYCTLCIYSITWSLHL